MAKGKIPHLNTGGTKEIEAMSTWKRLVLPTLAAAVVLPGKVALAQVSVGIGVAPVCPYGYFYYEPYDCAPYGYYGPDWFIGGVFIGAGPWFHGPGGFYGHVDNRFDPHYGYRGPLPSRGAERFNHFQSNEARDGMGQVGEAPHGGESERALPGFRGGGGGSQRGGRRR